MQGLAFGCLVALPERRQLLCRLLRLRHARRELRQGALLRDERHVLGDRVVGEGGEQRYDGKEARRDADQQGPRQDDVAAFGTTADMDLPLGEEVLQG